MVTEWSPNFAVLAKLLDLLSRAQIADTAIQRQILDGTEQLKMLSDGLNYLVFLFVSVSLPVQGAAAPVRIPIEVRQQAGLLLKNMIANKLTMRYPSGLESSVAATSNFLDRRARELAVQLAYVKARLPTVIGDPVRPIRLTCAAIISQIITGHGNIAIWPEISFHLLSALDSPNDHLLDGAFTCIEEVCEKNIWNMQHPQPGHGQLPSTSAAPPTTSISSTEQECSMLEKSFAEFCDRHLCAKLITFCTPQSKTLLKLHAINCMNMFVSADLMMADRPLHRFLATYWQKLANLMSDETKEVRRAVCEGIIAISGSNVQVRSLVFRLYCSGNCCHVSPHLSVSSHQPVLDGNYRELLLKQLQ